MNWIDKSISMFGELHWKACISELVGVNKTTVYRWSTGTHNICQAVLDKIDATYEIWRV